MSNRIERVNYYERQYLRSFDFGAEQRYHLEMRRRLNLALHLWGIVDGLEIVREPADTSKPVKQVYITSGMAIDAAGREIIVPFTRLLDEEDLLANRITVAGSYSLSIAYNRELATPPAPGYRICDLKDQYTRWLESFKIFIRDSSFSLPTTVPDFFGSLSDDPTKEWPIRLGTVQVNSNAGKLEIFSGVSENRTYVGLKAQHILPPTVVPPATSPLSKPEEQILKNVTPLDAPVSLAIEADVFARKNMVIGDNFVIDQTKIKPAPAPTPPATFPSLTGNLKVDGDVFLKGNFYAGVGADWLELKSYVQSLMPDIQAGVVTITPQPTATDPSNDTQVITLTSKLPLASKASMAASISGINRVSWTDYLDWLGNVNGGNPVQIEVSVGAIAKKAGTSNVFDFPISWTVGPKSNPPAPDPPKLHIQALNVNYIAIFYP